eukprot:13110-Eustigmatos_ZCMA.PRE.1
MAFSGETRTGLSRVLPLCCPSSSSDQPSGETMKLKFDLAGDVFALSAGAQAQTTWDLPAAYPATNFHS